MSRLIRADGSNVSPSDDALLFKQIFNDGLFETPTIANMGANVVNVTNIYGIVQGRDFRIDDTQLNVDLATGSGTLTGGIVVQLNVGTGEAKVISKNTTNVVYEDINGSGNIAEYMLATYTASNTQITNITNKFKTIDSLRTVVKNLTLNSNGWSGGVYTISDALVTAQSIQEVIPRETITLAQLKAYQNANIQQNGQQAGLFKLKAFGTVPSVNIPITVIFRGDK